MMNREQNELITRVGPGTKCGALMRHYWHPVALADELPDERPAKAVRVLGQDFVLFRDQHGRLGLLDRDCPHRGADLAYGRLEDGGLRCLFHGWLFDVDGKCLETPAEPEGSVLCQRVRQRSYPVVVKNGIVFAYLGEGEAPAFPDFDCFLAPGTHAFAFKGLIECNWLQALEVGIDPAHASYLHRFYEDEDPSGDAYGRQFRASSSDSDIPMTRMMREYPRPQIDVEGTDYGLRLFTLRKISDRQTHVRVTNLVFPYAFVIPMSTEMTITQWHVPIDDTSCYWYAIFTSFGAPVDHRQMREQRLQLYQLPDYRPRLGRHNQYGYNVAQQATQTYTGMGFDINVHDQWAIEGQGRIQDRTREHLGTSDKAIVAYRRLLLSAIGQVSNGEKPLMWLDPARRNDPRPDHRRRHEHAAGLAGLLEGVRRAPPQQLELGRRHRAAAGRVEARMTLVERAGLWTEDRKTATREAERRVQAGEMSVVRLAFADQHGVLRGKTFSAGEIDAALKNGVGFSATMLLKDTAHRTVFPVWQPGAGFDMKELEGAADVLMLPDPATFRALPWAPHSGWMLCDIYFADGRPMPLCTRHIYKRALNALADRGYDFFAGLEVEFHLFKLEKNRLDLANAGQPGQPGEPPDVSLLNQGYQYLTEQRYDEMDPILEILRTNIVDLGLPLRSIEVEFGPSQVEFTFRAGTGLEPADAMVLFKSAAKQVAQRHGYHATFMCRPKLANVMSSGWHLHQSLKDRKSHTNAFMDASEPLSAVGRHYMAGLLAHAQGAAAFSTPTLNGYKRYRPFSLAPDRAIWGRDNRGAMVRVLGGPGDPATHLENRVGEPAANPYLYMASQIVCGLDGLDRKLDPGPSADTPYEAKAPALPRSLAEALAALGENKALRAGFGDFFVDYYLKLKQAEIDRFNLEVSDWEQREYFSLF